MRRQLVDYAEQRKVHDHILKVIDMVKADHSGLPYVRYKDGWDDRKVAELFGYSQLQIKDFRRKHIGNENPGNVHKPHSRMVMVKRIDELENRILALENYVTTEVEVRTRGQGNGR